MDDARTIYITGLRNAHALEAQAMEMMERQIESLDGYRDVRTRLEQHLRETEAQRRRLQTILEQHDESPSTLKELATSFMGNVAALGHAMAGDAILKNTFSNFAFENFEIATYKSLIVMARAAGDEVAVPMLMESLREEEAMADWIDDHVEQVTMTYLGHEASGRRAAM